MTLSTTQVAPAAPRANTKKAQLIRLLRTKSGAGIAKLGDRLGWQPHTVRAALSRLRSEGHDVDRIAATARGEAKYRIAPKRQKTVLELAEGSEE